MLHKKHNSVVTLAILLTLVGVSKPAKAYLLAQSDPAAKTFAVPDKLPQDATVKIAASSSINGISASLKDSFASKYPQAKVQIKTQDSVTALKTLANGQADLAAIGRALTAAEKAQGFVSVPISREKIALVVSKNNPFDGNITIDQFAKIFRGEITDWSEIGGTSGKIQLIDAPNSNDTRQAFPNYPVFQTGEFKTGSTANQLKQDSVDAMIAKLGKNGIGYAVANDVIKRGDVKVISMHQTQPDDPRYPFSEPFNLIYKGTPSKATQAYLGFATSQGGKQVIANRVGSISAAAATAMASKTASASAKAGIDATKDSAIAVGKNTPNAAVNGKKTASAGNAQTATVPGKNTPNTAVNGKKTASAGNAQITTVPGKNAPQNKSGQGIIANADANGSGKANPDVQGSGEVNPDVQGSGEVNPNVQGSGEPLSATNDTDGVNADQAAVAPVAQADANPGTKVAEKKGTWWWWLLPLLGIPLLALAIWGGRKKSDQEPALNDIPNINSLDGRNSPPGSPDGGESVPLGANRPGGGLGNVAENAGNNVSNLGTAGLAAGGAALAGGAAANLAGRRNRIENVADADLDLDESTTVEEIPSNPVSEFTGQETKLQVSDQPTNLQLDDDDGEFTGQKTKLQVSDQPTNLQLDDDDELELNDHQPSDNMSLGSAAAIGGAAAVSSDSTELNLDNTVETATTDATAGREFPGDFVLEEESRSISVPDEVETDIDPHRADVTDITRGDIDTDVEVAEFSQDNDFNLDDRTDNIDTSVAFPDSVEDVTARDVDLSTDVDPNIDRPGIIDGITQAGGVAIAGGAAAAAAAASGMFNREDRTREDTDVDAAEFNQDTDLNLDERTEDSDSSATYIDTTDIDAPEFSQDKDLNLDERTEDSDPSATYIDTTDIDAPEVDLSTNVTPNIDEQTTSIDGVTQADDAAALGMFNYGDSQQTSDIQEFETFETSFDFSEDTTPTNFADNVVADAQTTSTDEINSLEGLTLDNLTNRADFNLDDITIDNEQSLDDITFDDATATEDLSFDEVTLDDGDSNINASLEEITFDEVTLDDEDSKINASLEEITFDDGNSDLNFDEITFEDTKVSNRNFVSDADSSTSNEEINLNNLGFEDLGKANTGSFDLLSDNRAEITSLDDNQSNDMNNISEWLDSLETPNQDSDNIAEWLDTLDRDSFRAEPNSAEENLNLEANTTKEANDISFQFLEDLLDRDSDPHRNNQ